MSLQRCFSQDFTNPYSSTSMTIHEKICKLEKGCMCANILQIFQSKSYLKRFMINMKLFGSTPVFSSWDVFCFNYLSIFTKIIPSTLPCPSLQLSSIYLIPSSLSLSLLLFRFWQLVHKFMWVQLHVWMYVHDT